MRMLAEDELRDAVLLVFANKQVRKSKQTRLKQPVYQLCPVLSVRVISDNPFNGQKTSASRSTCYWSFLPSFFRTYQTPWMPPRSQTSWACIPCVTATGTSRPRAPPAATAFTRALTGWPINWRTRNKQPERHTFCLFWEMRVPFGRWQQDSGVGVIIGLWFPVSQGGFAFSACGKQTLHVSRCPFSHRRTSEGTTADVGAVRNHESATFFHFLVLLPCLSPT